jgi:HSP20 family protein
MHISKFAPWGLFSLLQRDLDQLAARRLGLGGVEDNGNSVADYVPAVDVIEENERFVLRADLPGVDPQSITINMENGALSLAGERQSEKNENANGMHRIERTSGSFYRRFSLPESADADNITAKSSNGILEVVIPKKQLVQARRITVEAA